MTWPIRSQRTHFFSQYFPPVVEDKIETEESTQKDRSAVEEAEAKIDAEAKAIADELPDPPTNEPTIDVSGPEHVDKKSKQE